MIQAAVEWLGLFSEATGCGERNETRVNPNHGLNHVQDTAGLKEARERSWWKWCIGRTLHHTWVNLCVAGIVKRNAPAHLVTKRHLRGFLNAIPFTFLRVIGPYGSVRQHSFLYSGTCNKEPLIPQHRSGLSWMKRAHNQQVWLYESVQPQNFNFLAFLRRKESLKPGSQQVIRLPAFPWY